MRHGSRIQVRDQAPPVRTGRLRTELPGDPDMTTRHTVLGSILVAVIALVLHPLVGASPTPQPGHACDGVLVQMTCCWGGNWRRIRICMPVQKWNRYFEPCIKDAQLSTPCPPGEQPWLIVKYSNCPDCNASDQGFGFIRKLGSCLFPCASQGEGGCIDRTCYSLLICTPWSLDCNEW